MQELGRDATNGRVRRSPWVVFTLLAVTQFMVVLDASIVYVALPFIQKDLHFSPTGLAWVMDTYMLAFGGFMLLGGRATDLLGGRRTLIAGMVLFSVASQACGLSMTAWQLISSRAAQGLAAAMMAPAALALVTDTFEEGPERYRALGIFGGVGGLAGATGTLFGGLLTTVAWQLAFLINVPIILGVLLLGARMLPVGRATATGGVDLLGAIVGTTGVCLLLYGVLRGGTAGWNSTTTLVSFAIAVILLAVFVIRQLRAAAPLIPRILFRLRNVVLGNVANAVTGALLFGVLFILTLYLQQVRGFTPLEAALRTMPISVALFIGSQVTFRLFGRIGPIDVLAGSLVLQALALVWWAQGLGTQSDILVSFLLPGMVWAFGLGAAIVAAFVVCTSGLRGHVQGAASGLVSATLQIGGAVGLATLSTIADRRTGSLTADHLVSTAEAMASGQAYALWRAAVIAIIGIPAMVWLRASWQLTDRLRRPASRPGADPARHAGPGESMPGHPRTPDDLTVS
jgi:EmrB/QacA subfamily drug resistance transporter